MSPRTSLLPAWQFFRYLLAGGWNTAFGYDRHLQTKAGEVDLKVTKLRGLRFETAIIERYRR